MFIKVTLLLTTLLAICSSSQVNTQSLGYLTQQHHPVHPTVVNTVQTVRVPQPVPVPVPQPIPVPQPVPVQVQVESIDPYPQYNFAYSVNDFQTGDSKSQHETREGDVVRGQYSVSDPDGTRRTVDYSADPQNGFNAVVQRTLISQHPQQLLRTPH
ncbi:larval cuticle protein A2B-like [Harmonia axyridis]|uniref:larval cuticle protein A2B-like n=1 Tax=Harmonia axyridis TaxID=115357 RepID=UPI001E2772FB|nr:larval cuticle protein A2B-like [Harmonia axyridis]